MMKSTELLLGQNVNRQGAGKSRRGGKVMHTCVIVHILLQGRRAMWLFCKFCGFIVWFSGIWLPKPETVC